MARGKATPKRKRSLQRFLVMTTAFTCAGIGALSFVFWHYGRDLPSVSTLTQYLPPQTTRVVDRNGRLIGEIFRERRTVVPLGRVPRVLVLSVLAAEDADFYQHRGLDYAGILRAMLRGVLAGRPTQGASTITQQVVKTMLLTPERTLSRKFRELILARRLEWQLSKDEILYLYLNHINFGHGRYGVQEAAQYYFGKDVGELTLAQASLIAGIPQAPSRLSPRLHPDAARKRQLYVLGQLERKRDVYWPDLTAGAIEAARNERVELVSISETESAAPEVIAVARNMLRERVSDDEYQRGGYTVHTTIDLELQKVVREKLRKGLEAVDARHGYRAPIKARPDANVGKKRRLIRRGIQQLRLGETYQATVVKGDDRTQELHLEIDGHAVFADLREAERYNPSKLAPTLFADPGAKVRVSLVHGPDANEDEGPAKVQLELGPQGAVVVMDVRTREVRAIVGGYESTSGFDRSLRAIRQPGSAFKPIVYALAIKERKFTPASLVLDAPAVYDQWRPQNNETWSYEGPIRVREALARSINLVAVRVAEEVTPQGVVTFARQLGISTPLDPSLALALGSSGVRPIELVNAYATFAGGGRWLPSRIVSKIQMPDGTATQIRSKDEPRDVLTPAESFIVTNLLESVVRTGTGAQAARLQRPLAGKTGTSNDARDAWFVGYTPETVAGVWVGFDEPRSLGRRESGAKTALPIWMDVIGAVEKNKPASEFAAPSGVETALIDPATGLLAYEGEKDAIQEVFLAGTVPTETARPPENADPNTFMMEQFGNAQAE